MTYDLSSATAQSVHTATNAAIAKANGLVEEAVSAEDHTFASVMRPLDDAICTIQDAMGYGPFLSNFHTDKAVRDAGNEAEELLANWLTDLMSRSDVFEAVSGVDADALAGLEARLHRNWMRDLKRAGHGLPEATRNRVKELQTTLTSLQIEYAKNIAEYKDHLEVPTEELAMMPAAYLDSLEEGDTPGTVKVTLDYPAFFPFIEQVPNRELRRQLRHKYQNRAVAENRPLLERAIAVRFEMAELLGYDDWAAYAMELKMADAESVAALYASVIPGLTDLATAEKAKLQAMLEADEDGATLQQWDWRYYHNLQRTNDYGIDQNKVAEYFPLEAVIEGMLDVTGSVLGIAYVPLPEEPTWHEDVLSYRIDDADTGEHLAVFHLDLYPREGKFTHAACWNPVNRRVDADGTVRIPVGAVAANFTKPSGDTPSLLKHDEAVTLWHEFGHVLHACLTRVDEQTFAGFDTEWDFVEAPSQIMENWMWNAEVLRHFARHHETGEPIPEDLVSALVAARDQNVGLQTLRQVFLGQYDLQMHTSGPEPDLDALQVETTKYTLLPLQPDTFMAASFGHLMGGYDAGYYGYLWANVYGDDMFSVFEAEGVMSPEVGRRYRTEVLERGSSRDAIEDLRAFLGREPNADAFLANLGISQQS